ncbi:sugar phosphate isomerase/epimerase [Mucilaginibacter sp. dw_454]|uniref:sugar phosphate isomerase/epimerase family protein n=1 Tax=Mucilaginibacter sp. dw_454 TaxID=2720079 RepID=UPI001BD4DC96|nr:sugar phosphate isomerase/epimerase [Mucilaginibacter sp. dw_454]
MKSPAIQFFCPRWGSQDLGWNIFLAKVRAAGYDGVEWAITGDAPESQLNEVWKLAQHYGLSLIAQHYDTRTTDYALHYDTYAAWLEKVKPYPWLKINSQTGLDHFSFEQNAALIRLTGNVVHETHRGKFSFAAHITRAYLEAIPELRLTLDASHWVNVAESFLADQEAAMTLAISRTEHIHARVGYTQGPQVPDQRAPEWQFAVDHHLAWWDKVIERKRQEAGAVMTITTEFGPYPYLVELPYSRQPVSDQWEMNLYMMNLLKQRYA